MLVNLLSTVLVGGEDSIMLWFLCHREHLNDGVGEGHDVGFAAVPLFEPAITSSQRCMLVCFSDGFAGR